MSDARTRFHGAWLSRVRPLDRSRFERSPSAGTWMLTIAASCTMSAAACDEASGVHDAAATDDASSGILDAQPGDRRDAHGVWLRRSRRGPVGQRGPVLAVVA